MKPSSSASLARPVIALCFTILVWGVAPAFIRGLALATGPHDAMFIRMWVTAIAALPLFLLNGWRIERRDIPTLLLISMIGNFGYFLGSIFGYSLVPAGFGTMIIAIQPFMIALLAVALGRDTLSKAALLGLTISLAGTIYLFSGNIGGSIPFDAMVKGVLLFLFCDIGWAIYVVFSRPLVQKYGTFKISAWVLVLSAVPSVVFFSETTIPTLLNLDGQSVFSLLFLSMVGTVICTTTWNFAVQHLSATTMGASLYLIPLLAVAAGWAVLGEEATFATLVAGVVILSGVAIAEFGKTMFLTAEEKT
ncbi:MAG: DMT family transporter [Aestuariivirga sp.]